MNIRNRILKDTFASFTQLRNLLQSQKQENPSRLQRGLLPLHQTVIGKFFHNVQCSHKLVVMTCFYICVRLVCFFRSDSEPDRVSEWKKKDEERRRELEEKRKKEEAEELRRLREREKEEEEKKKKDKENKTRRGSSSSSSSSNSSDEDVDDHPLKKSKKPPPPPIPAPSDSDSPPPAEASHQNVVFDLTTVCQYSKC